MSKQPQYPHVPKKREPLYPHKKGTTESELTPEISNLLNTPPDALIDKYDLPRGKAMPRTFDQSNRLIELAIKAYVGAKKVAITENHPAWKVVIALENLMNEHEFSTYQQFTGYERWEPLMPATKQRGISSSLSEGGEPIPPQYRGLIDYIDEPLPEYALMTIEVEEGERKIDAVMRSLKSGVDTIQQSENFRQFLTTMSKFHDYSIGNQILIMVQKPEATKVAGFNTWKDLGRWVKKGESGIAILAPRFPSRPTCPECGAGIPKGAKYCPRCGASVEVKEEVEMEPAYFVVVSVFDISQTEGKPLPEFEVPTLTGVANEELFAKAMVLARAKRITVSFEPKPGLPPEVKGYYIAGEIWVRPEEPRAQQLKTFLHELAHHYSESVFLLPSRDAETIAESAAYVVGDHYGFDTGVRSFPYVAMWAQDEKVLKENLGAIRKVATTILEGLERS